MRKPTKKGLTLKLDKEFSRQVRAIGYCERCGATPEEMQLHCSHIVTRSNRRLRWDFSNANCLCARCHRWAHDHPTFFTEWLREHCPEKLDYVVEHAHELVHRSVPDLEDLLAELKAQDDDPLRKAA